MQIEFESNEKLVMTGFLYLLKQATIQNKDRKLLKFVNRLVNKFSENALIINLKKDEMNTLSKILQEAIEDNERNSKEGQPRLSEDDLAACEGALEKLEEKLSEESDS